jgi:CheY-like chemotaxis protein
MGELVRAMLLVEDNPADIYLIQKAVEECDKTIHLCVVPHGRDALAFLRKEGIYALEPSPALILLDLSLPSLDGHDVLVELRRMPAYQHTPVVVFSSARREAEEASCLRLGANTYIQKPTEIDDFFAAIRDTVYKWLLQTDAS